MATTSPLLTPSSDSPRARLKTPSTNCPPVFRWFPDIVSGASRRRLEIRLKHWQMWPSFIAADLLYRNVDGRDSLSFSHTLTLSSFSFTFCVSISLSLWLCFSSVEVEVPVTCWGKRSVAVEESAMRSVIYRESSIFVLRRKYPLMVAGVE